MFFAFVVKAFGLTFPFDFNFNSISLWASCTSKVSKQGSRLCSIYKVARFQFFFIFLLDFVFDSWYNASVDKREANKQGGGKPDEEPRVNLGN